MRRHLIGIAAALALGITPVVAVASPALASVHVCTEFGQKFCLDASSLAAGTPITTDSKGRDIILQDQGFTHEGFEVFRLVFALDTSKCVGFSSTGLAEVRDCSGNSNYTNWMRAGTYDNEIWENNSSTECDSHDPGIDLTSDNYAGDRVFCSTGTKFGEYIKWTP